MVGGVRPDDVMTDASAQASDQDRFVAEVVNVDGRYPPGLGRDHCRRVKERLRPRMGGLDIGGRLDALARGADNKDCALASAVNRGRAAITSGCSLKRDKRARFPGLVPPGTKLV